MAGKLLHELHKDRPFESVQQEVILNILRTADHVRRGFEELLKPHNLSSTQYNVLRILRGQNPRDALRGEKPPCPSLPCKSISEQMITRDPDITRLLDRLESRGLLTRQRDTADRRVVTTRITEEGMRVLAQLDAPVVEFRRQQLAHMPDDKLAQLIELLEMVRADGAPRPASPDAHCSEET